MHTAIIILLVVIVLVLLGLFAPMLFAVAWTAVAVAPKLFAIGATFVVCLVGLIAYHAVRGDI